MDKNQKQKVDTVVRSVVYYFFAAVLAAYFLLPFFVLLTRAFMTFDEVKSLRGRLVPNSFLNFKNFVIPFKNAGDGEVNFASATFNSVSVMLLKATFVTLSSFLCSYALSRIDFRGNKILFSCGMVTIMLPGIVSTLPLYRLYFKMNWLDTLFPLWVPSCFGGGMMTIFLEMQFIKTIPRTMDEAAKIDGANYLDIGVRIILPLVKPILIYTAVTTAIGSWNDFMGPYTFITSEVKNFTLPLAFFKKYSNGQTDAVHTELKAALSLVMMIPIFVLFAIFHEQMIKGVSLGSGIKG